MMISLTLFLATATAAQEDFFPMEPGTVWVYRTHGGRDFVKKVLGQEKVGETCCSILQIGETDKHWLSAGGDGVRVHRSKGLRFEEPLLLFRFPLKRGDTWTGQGRTPTGAIAYSFTNAGEEDVEVPAGRFTTFRIDWKIGEGPTASIGSTWLAKGFGSVKEAYATGGVESSLALLRIRKPGDTYLPLGKGFKWTYKTDYGEETDIVHEVSGVEKVGDAECFVVEHKTVNADIGTRVLRKEWLAATAEGVLIHKVQRGRSILEVEKPFFKVKNELRKDDEWSGAAKADENPPTTTVRVEEEVEVEVPAGKYTARKILVKVESGVRHQAESHEWYVRNVGLVKSELTIRSLGEAFTVVSELKKFEGAK